MRSEIFVTSDTHFGHDNIRKYCNRPFPSCPEMDEAIMQNWNEKVKNNDIIYHLGDFSFTKNTAETNKYLNRLNGKIVLIRGNHDKKSVVSANFFEVYSKYQGKMLTVSEDNYYLNHFPHLSWDRSHYGVFHLFGHCHGELKNPPINSLDVGVDANNFTPLNIEEVKEKFKNKNG